MHHPIQGHSLALTFGATTDLRQDPTSIPNPYDFGRVVFPDRQLLEVVMIVDHQTLLIREMKDANEAERR